MNSSNRPLLRTAGTLVGSMFLVIGPLIPVSAADSTSIDVLGAVIYLAMGAAFVRYGILGDAAAKIRSGRAITLLSVLVSLVLASISLYSAVRDVEGNSFRTTLQAIGIAFGVAIVVHALVQRRRHQGSQCA